MELRNEGIKLSIRTLTMSLAEFIRSYHRQNLCPEFNRKKHNEILQEHIKGFASDDFAAVDSFAAANGFRVVLEDYNFRFKFIPAEMPDDCEDYRGEEVPVDRAP